MFNRGLLNKILMLLEGESRVVGVLERRIEALEEREGELLNRFMARNYGEYILGKDVIEERVETIPLPEEALEENAGMSLEVKE